MYEKGMSVIVASVIRNHPNALSPRLKSLNYLNNILAKLEAIDANVSEAIMLNHEGNVAECTADNIFIVRNGQVQTPQTNDGILEGVTRRVMLELCAACKFPQLRKPCSVTIYTSPTNVFSPVPEPKSWPSPASTDAPSPMANPAQLRASCLRHSIVGCASDSDWL